MADHIQLAVIFLILALICFMMGMKGMTGFSMEIVKWPVLIFIAIAIILLVW
jgi:uncharacterized membrane protein YtjA (UPF0391 family)